jgi:pimeloyl-ACP methyl ester carboxylesterase
MPEHVVVTAGGRELNVVEAGDPSGAAIVVHHGTPGSRLLFGPWIEDAERRGIRLIGYERPGYGGSTRQPGRNVADAASDVAAIADALEIGRLAVWGGSGGGPHALACAALLPERVAAAATLASVAPYPADGLDWLAGMGEDNIDEFSAALRGPEELEPLLERLVAGLLAADAEAIADQIRSLLSPPDAAVLTGEVASFMHGSTQAGLRGGIHGWLDDDLAFTKQWGFGLDEIAVPVLVWQGMQDKFVPPAHGEWLAAHVAGAEARLAPEDGHLTLTARRIPEVHAWLLERLS